MWCRGLLRMVPVCIGVFLSACHSGSDPVSDVEIAGRPVYTENREPCSNFNPLRNLYFGDLHVHTALSHETWTLDVRAGTEDALRFARGEPIGLPPLDEDDIGTRTHQLQRPLDFAAVTDHGEFFVGVKNADDVGDVFLVQLQPPLHGIGMHYTPSTPSGHES